MLDFSVYLLYRAAFALVTALPLPVISRLGNFSGTTAWLFLGKYRRLARHNMAIAFGMEKSPRELRRMVRRHFQRLGADILCALKVSVLPLPELEERVKVENFDLIHRQLRAGRGVVAVLSHLGTMELFAHILPRVLSYARTADIYQKLNNRFIDRHVQRLRGRAGVEMFDRSEGFQKAIELLRGGGGIGIPSDQHSGDQGLWTPFFGRLASTTPLAALLAKRADAVLVGIALYTVKPGYWRMVAETSVETRGQSLESLTATVNEITAEQIRLAPADWFWVHERWKTPRPNFLLARYKRGVYLPEGISAKDLQPFRILIRASNWLGDSVISIPAVRAIKAGRPDAHITIAAPGKIAAIWKLVPEVDEVIPLREGRLFGTVRLLRRQTRFDVAILFPNSLRVALEAWLAGIPRRVGYRGHCRRWLLNQIATEPQKVGPPQHQAFRYLRMAEELGADAGPLSFPKLARKDDVDLSSEKIALAPGAEYGPAKRWLPDRFAEVAKKIAEQRRVQWVLFGTKNDASIGRDICEAVGDNCVNRIGQTTIEQLIDELRQCRLLLTNDTGTMHLASLLGVPMVAIFGSTEPRLTGPLGADHIVLRHQVECSPCFLRECPIDFRCMKAISAQEVIDAVLSILHRDTTKNAKSTKMI